MEVRAPFWARAPVRVVSLPPSASRELPGTGLAAGLPPVRTAPATTGQSLLLFLHSLSGCTLIPDLSPPASPTHPTEGQSPRRGSFPSFMDSVPQLLIVPAHSRKRGSPSRTAQSSGPRLPYKPFQSLVRAMKGGPETSWQWDPMREGESQPSVGPWHRGGERDPRGSQLVLPPPVAQALHGPFIQPK